MLRLPDSWIWDSWYVRDGATYHVFFLYASRALGEPALRHRRAAIGHAVSRDLRTWERVEDALVHGSPPSFDQAATWTGSVVRGDDDRWYLFYTGATVTDEGPILQQIGLAVSNDLTQWQRHDSNPLLKADARWYEKVGGPPEWQDEHWRDPWVMRDPAGDGWHMLITARSSKGAWDERGVIGHARSDDLVSWTVQPPLTEPHSGFGLMEVPQIEEVDGRVVMVFNCPKHQLGAAGAGRTVGGVWVARGGSRLGPFDVAGASLLVDERLYVGKLLQDPRGDWVLLAFVNVGSDGGFGGELTDPLPVQWVGDELVVQHPASPRWGRERTGATTSDRRIRGC